MPRYIIFECGPRQDDGMPALGGMLMAPEADSALLALDAYSVKHGSAPYTSSDEGLSYVTLWQRDELSDRVEVASAVFSNYEVVAVPAQALLDKAGWGVREVLRGEFLVDARESAEAAWAEVERLAEMGPENAAEEAEMEASYARASEPEEPRDELVRLRGELVDLDPESEAYRTTFDRIAVLVRVQAEMRRIELGRAVEAPAPERRSYELTEEQATLVAAVIGHALDQDHDSYEGDYLLQYAPEDTPFELTDDEAGEEWKERNREIGAALEAAARVLQGQGPDDAARAAEYTRAVIEGRDDVPAPEGELTLVRDLESEGQPIVGRWVGSGESVVFYQRPDGEQVTAPADCVRVERHVAIAPRAGLPGVTVAQLVALAEVRQTFGDNPQSVGPDGHEDDFGDLTHETLAAFGVDVENLDLREGGRDEHAWARALAASYCDSETLVEWAEVMYAAWLGIPEWVEPLVRVGVLGVTEAELPAEMRGPALEAYRSAQRQRREFLEEQVVQVRIPFNLKRGELVELVRNEGTGPTVGEEMSRLGREWDAGMPSAQALAEAERILTLAAVLITQVGATPAQALRAASVAERG